MIISDEFELILLLFHLTLIPRFHLEVDTSHKIELYCAGMLKAKNGIKLKLYTAP